MKHLKDPKTPINKFANSLRLMGILLLVASSIGFISYRSDSGNFWDIYTLFLLTLPLQGVFWRSLAKRSGKSSSRTATFHAAKSIFTMKNDWRTK
jgi:hypothetical protein